MSYKRTVDWPEPPEAHGSVVLLGEDFDGVGHEEAEVSLVTRVVEALEKGSLMPGKLYVPFRQGSCPSITSEMLDYWNADADVTYMVMYYGRHSIQAVRERLSYMYWLDPSTKEPTDSRVEIAGNVVLLDTGAGGMVDRMAAAMRYIKTHSLDRDNTVIDWGKASVVLKAKAARKLRDFLENRRTAGLKEVRSKVMSTKERLDMFRSDVISEAKKLETLQLELEALSLRGAEALEKQQEEDIQELMAYENLVDMEMEGQSVTFITAPLFIREPNDENGRVRPIGDYRVSVSLENASVNFTSLNNRINRQKFDNDYGRGQPVIPHPHCDANGTPCMGNMAAALSDLVQTDDLLGIWQIVLSFLTSYNPQDSWGKRSRFWPLYEADGITPVNEADKTICHICGTGINTAIPYDYENTDNGGGLQCPVCGLWACPDCVQYNDDSEVDLCENCQNDLWCEACEETHGINTEWERCEQCGSRICRECAEEGNGRYEEEMIYFCCTGHRQDWEQRHEYDCDDEECQPEDDGYDDEEVE